jgi:hypothetical protein
MSETIDINKYLDLDGLKKYDELIKSYITFGNESLSSDVSSIKIDVADLKKIDHNAYISADEQLKGYIDDGLILKQDVISDLKEIRSGAALGATAIQEIPDIYITESELAEKAYVNTEDVEYIIDSSVITASNDDIDDLFK